MNNRGTYIIFDGIDGAGKETQMFKTLEWLYSKDKRYQNILATREPTYRGHGAKARELLKSDGDPMANREQALEYFVMDRREHLGLDIVPAILRGHVVLQDRGKYSTVAYQGSQGIPVERILELNYGIQVPDLVLILDLTAAEALKRRQAAGSAAEKFEKPDFLQSVRNEFLKMRAYFPHENIVMVDAAGTPDKVFERVKEEVSKIIPY